MSEPDGGRRCQATGLHLLAAVGETGYRVAKDRYGALSGRPYAPGTDGAESRGRFDTIGTTLYFADSPECAYAEVLTGFRFELAATFRDADAAGYTPAEWVDLLTEQAIANGVDPPWAVSCDWQLARSIYQVRMPRNGWWVQIDHYETLNALVDHYAHRGVSETSAKLLTSADLEGGDRALTTVLAEHIRNLLLDDGSEPLGIYFRSKTLYGHCWAFWDRRTDAGLGQGSNDPVQVTSDNVGPDPAFLKIAHDYNLTILPGQPA